jgi:hypothetical protein
MTRLAAALERAFNECRPLLVFGAWRATGSLSAAVSTLLLSAGKRLRGVPLNPTIGVVPLHRFEEGALLLPRIRVRKVAVERPKARVLRIRTNSAMPGDMVDSEWDVAARVLGRDQPTLRLPIASFIALDTIRSNGELRIGSRPVLGRHSRRGEPRLPRLLGLRTQDSSDRAITVARGADIALYTLDHARGPKTQALLADALRSLRPNRPALVLSDGTSDLARLERLGELTAINASILLTEAPPVPAVNVLVVNQARVQAEEQFSFAVPSDLPTPLEAEVAHASRALWAWSWRALTFLTGTDFLSGRLQQGLAALNRGNPGSASSFRLLEQLLHQTSEAMQTAAKERLAATVGAASAVQRSERRGAQIIVASAVEVDLVLRELKASLGTNEISVARWQDLVRTSQQRAVCIVAAYYGSRTLDTVLRCRPTEIVWVVDPIEARIAAADFHQQAVALARLGLKECADLVERVDTALVETAARSRSSVTTERAAEFQWLASSALEGAPHEPPEAEDAADPDADFVLVLSDGGRVRVSAGRRFDVMRAGAPQSVTASAASLQEGDHILFVTGTHQQTLSDLLLEDLDRAELHNEAVMRRTWLDITHSAVEIQKLTATHIAKRLTAIGLKVSPQRIRSWLGVDEGERAPRDWKAFLAFAQVIGLQLGESEIHSFFQAIRRWRVAHRLRGREIIRVLRLAWFGGLSAGALGRIEERWGLGVRDLVEGSRVEEIETIIKLRA